MRGSITFTNAQSAIVTLPAAVFPSAIMNFRFLTTQHFNLSPPRLADTVIDTSGRVNPYYGSNGIGGSANFDGVSWRMF